MIDSKNTFFSGSNIEVLWQRCYHAEEAAIIGAMSHDAGKIKAICVACERRLFTPCGHCMDLILEFAAADAIFIYYNTKVKESTVFKLEELMPHYPTRD